MNAATNREGRPINVALVNNMPDAAFLDTERQFCDAVMNSGADAQVHVGLYTMPGLTRSEAVAAVIRSRYSGLDELWESSPDALIVTGTEPVQSQLQYEPYWPHLAQILQWADATVPVTLLSCLAAHASLLMFDGLERKPLATKCSGVFDGALNSNAGPLSEGLPEVVPVPHSRVNDVAQRRLSAAGYTVVIGSEEGDAGWSVATRAQGHGTFVLCQGHLEYSTESLLREYRRDVRRFLFGRGAVSYPTMPVGYFTAETEALLSDYRTEAELGSDQDPMELYERFPYAVAHATLVNRWSESSVGFYRNWLALAGVPAGASTADTR